MKTRLLCFLMVLALLPCLALAEDAPQKLVVAEPVHLIGYLPLYVAIHEGTPWEKSVRSRVDSS